MYTVVWKYTINPDHRHEFEREYGAEGTWSMFFRRSKDYLGSELYGNMKAPDEYLLTDRWNSQQAYEQFIREHEHLYGELSEKFEHLYLNEQRLGDL